MGDEEKVLYVMRLFVNGKIKRPYADIDTPRTRYGHALPGVKHFTNAISSSSADALVVARNF